MTERKIGFQAGVGLVVFVISQVLLVGFVVGHFTGHSKTVTAAALTMPAGKSGEGAEATAANSREGIGPERE